MVDLPRVPRRVATVEEPRSRISEGEVAAPYRMLSKGLAEAGNALEDIAEPLGEQLGYKSVTTADDGSLVIQRGPLPMVGKAGDAFERASKISYVARLKPEIETELLKMRLENPHDPDAYEKTSRAYTERIVSNAERAGGPVLVASVRTIAEQAAAQNYRTALTQTDALNVQNAGLAYRSQIADLDHKGAALARQGGTDTEEYKQIQADVLSLYQELGGDKRFKYPPDRIEREIGEMADRHGAQAIIGGMRQYFSKGTPSAKAEAQKYLVDNMWDPKLFPRLSPAERQGFVAQGLAWLESQTSENKALRDANAKFVSETIESLKSGAPYDARVVNDLKQRSIDIGDVESHSKLTIYENLKGFRDGLFKQPIGTQIATLRELQAGPSTFEASLVGRESRGRTGIVNELGYAGAYQFGAPRLVTLGVYRPGTMEDLGRWSFTPKDAPAKWSGTFNVPGFPEVKTLQDFLGNPEAQRVTFVLHRARMDQEISGNGLDRFEGKIVGGVPITREGLYAMLHLGGIKSTTAALESDGRINPKDKNGTTVLDYARLGQPAITASTGAGPLLGGALRQELINDLRKHYSSEAEKLVTTATKALGIGRRLNDEEVHNLAEIITATGRTDLAERLSVAISGFDAGQKLTALPMALRNTWRAAMQARAADAPDPLERQVIDFAEEMVKRVQVDMEAKPYTTGAARGLHAEPFPLDPANPGTFAAAVRQRSAMDQIHQKHDGVGPRSVFEPGEAEAFRGALINAKPEQVAQLFQGLQQLDDGQLVATLGDEKIKDAVRNAMRTSDPAKYNAVMTSLDQVYARAPRDFTKLMGDDALHALKTWQANLRYLDPKTLLEERRRLDDPQVMEAHKRAIKAGEEIAAKKTPEEIAEGIRNVWFRTADNATPPPLDERTLNAFMGDYENIYGRRFAETRNAEIAHQQTIEMMRTKWQRSELNDNRLMLRAPETVYPAIGGSHAWMKAQLERDLEAKFGPRYARSALPSAGIGLGAQVPLWDYALVADRQTEAEAQRYERGKPPSETNREPRYEIVVINKRTNKAELVYGDDGRPLRYRWDTSGVAADEERFTAERARVLNPSLTIGAP